MEIHNPPLRLPPPDGLRPDQARPRPALEPPAQPAKVAERSQPRDALAPQILQGEVVAEDEARNVQPPVAQVRLRLTQAEKAEQRLGQHGQPPMNPHAAKALQAYRRAGEDDDGKRLLDTFA